MRVTSADLSGNSRVGRKPQSQQMNGNQRVVLIRHQTRGKPGKHNSTRTSTSCPRQDHKPQLYPAPPKNGQTALRSTWGSMQQLPLLVTVGTIRHESAPLIHGGALHPQTQTQEPRREPPPPQHTHMGQQIIRTQYIPHLLFHYSKGPKTRTHSFGLKILNFLKLPVNRSTH